MNTNERQLARVEALRLLTVEAAVRALALREGMMGERLLTQELLRLGYELRTQAQRLRREIEQPDRE